MVRYDSQRERLAIGSTGQVLTVASSLPTWATLTTADSVLTTQGDVLYESASGLARLGFGTSGDVLTTKGTGADPAWETPSGGATITVQKISPTNNQTTTSTTLTNLTAGSATLANRTGGKAFMVYQQCIEKSTDGHMQQAFYYNGATQESIQTMIVSPHYITGTNSAIDDLDGGTVQLMWMGDSGTLTLRNTGNQQSYCDIFEVS